MLPPLWVNPLYLMPGDREMTVFLPKKGSVQKKRRYCFRNAGKERYNKGKAGRNFFLLESET